jgi:hypothetical protein
MCLRPTMHAHPSSLQCCSHVLRHARHAARRCAADLLHLWTHETLRVLQGALPEGEQRDQIEKAVSSHLAALVLEGSTRQSEPDHANSAATNSDLATRVLHCLPAEVRYTCVFIDCLRLSVQKGGTQLTSIQRMQYSFGLASFASRAASFDSGCEEP